MERMYRIADLTVRMDTFGRTERQAAPYVSTDQGDSAVPNICIRTDWKALQRSQPHLSCEDCEYLATGWAFYAQLLRFGGLMLHASALEMDGKAYLFAAPSGGGKSTHTALWLQKYGADRIRILNDDKPALRQIGQTWYAYGTPWCGCSDVNLNVRAPIRAIVLLEKGEVNSIRPFADGEALTALLNVTLRPRDGDGFAALLTHLDALIQSAPLWKLVCTADEAAVQAVYDTVCRDGGDRHGKGKRT